MTDLNTGIHNLLVNCAQVQSGESLLIVHEDPSLGWYDMEAPEAVSEAAIRMGLTTTMMQVGGPTLAKDSKILDGITAHDSTIFFARIGDQDRFDDKRKPERSVMVYARDVTSLSSAFGTTDHRAMSALKEAVNEVTFSADRIEITCPLGTQYCGTVQTIERESAGEVTVKRFPLGVPQPVPAANFSGCVALARYLTPTGSMPYEPASCRIDSTVMAIVESGRIIDFEGDALCVAAIRQHYDRVSSRFGIDPDCIHSWHAGIHPGCFYDGQIDDNPDRWSNNVFTHPRFLHLHTCGNYAPGEICWMILDHTVLVDDTPLWLEGRLMFENFGAISDIVSRWPELHNLLLAPGGPIGINA